MRFPPKWSAAAYLLLVFLSGAVVGAFAYRLYAVRAVVSSTARSKLSPQEYRKKAVREMSNRLNLTPDQVQNLQRIMDETRKCYRDAHENIFAPQMKAIENEQHDKIRSILNGTQRTEYDKMLAEREAHRKTASANRSPK